MSSESGRSGRKDQGPQGTQVFSREEVSQLIDDAAGEPASGSRAELTGLSSSVSGQSFALGSTRILVGRASACDLQFDDPSVSSEHARIVRDSAGWRVVNLLSTNGTFVNDRKISSSAIANGDRIRFGRVEFRFHDPDQAAGNGSAGKGLPVWPIVFTLIGLAAVGVVVFALL